MATPLDVVFASGGDAEIFALELQCAAWPEPLRLCDEYEDLVLGLETGEAALFEGEGIDYSLPKINSSGGQTTQFAIDNVRGKAQRLLDLSEEAGERVTMMVRRYVGSDLSAPAQRPLRYTVKSAGMEGAAVKIEAGFFDMLNRAWPPNYYTSDKFPGLKYQ